MLACPSLPTKPCASRPWTTWRWSTPRRTLPGRPGGTGAGNLRGEDRADQSDRPRPPMVQGPYRPGCRTDAARPVLLRPRHHSQRTADGDGRLQGSAFSRQSAGHRAALHPLLRRRAPARQQWPGHRHTLPDRPEPAAAGSPGRTPAQSTVDPGRRISPATQPHRAHPLPAPGDRPGAAQVTARPHPIVEPGRLPRAAPA